MYFFQLVSSPALNAYLDSMTYNWNSYNRDVQFATLMNSIDLSDSQFATFTTYLERINSNVTS